MPPIQWLLSTHLLARTQKISDDFTWLSNLPAMSKTCSYDKKIVKYTLKMIEWLYMLSFSLDVDFSICLEMFQKYFNNKIQ